MPKTPKIVEPALRENNYTNTWTQATRELRLQIKGVELRSSIAMWVYVIPTTSSSVLNLDPVGMYDTRLSSICYTLFTKNIYT